MRRMIWGIILAACVHVGSTVAEDTVFGGAHPKNPHFHRLKHVGEPFLSPSWSRYTARVWRAQGVPEYCASLDD